MESTTTGQGGEVHAHVEANPSKGEGMSGKFPGDTASTDVVFTEDRAGAPAGSESMRERAGEMASQAKERAGQAMSRLEESGAMNTVRDNPLVALGVAFGVGFILAGSSGTGGQVGKAKNQLKGAVMGGLSAAVAQELRNLVGMQGGSGGPGGMLGNVFGQGGGHRSAGDRG